MTRSSALVRSPHHLHGLGNMTPLLRFVVFAPAFACLGLLRGLRDRRGTMLLEHLARDGVHLGFGYHVALLVPVGSRGGPPPAGPLSNGSGRAAVPPPPGDFKSHSGR